MLGFGPGAWLVVPYVMVAQAFSGIAKDLTKMSSKSAVKLVVPEESEASLYKWVAILTGSKNALKGVGFFLGGLLLTVTSFQTAMLILAAMVPTALTVVSLLMHGGLGRTDAKAKFRHMFSNNRAVNLLAAARSSCSPRAMSGSSSACRSTWQRPRLELLGGRHLHGGLGDRLRDRAGFGAALRQAPGRGRGTEPDGRTATWLAFVLAAFPAGIAIALAADFDPTTVLVVGLIAFGVIFALNSAVHSYLILSYADNEKVAMNVGFYYMANAGGPAGRHRALGPALPVAGLEACLWASAIFVLAAGADLADAAHQDA